MARHAQPIIGIAGGIGSGKSAVAEALRDLGCVVVNSDDLARAALEDASVRARLRERWGGRAFDERGRVDRSAVAAIVFNDPAERAWLESVTHPWIEARRLEVFAAAPPDAAALVIDAPLLFEAGLAEQCDAVIFVDTPRELRLQRLQAARGWDEAELARREAAQMPLDEKRWRSHHVVRNIGDLSDLREQVRRILGQILEHDAPG